MLQTRTITKNAKDFYFKNGYTPAGFSCKMHGNNLEVVINKGRVIGEEFLALFKKYMGSVLFIFFKPQIRR